MFWGLRAWGLRVSVFEAPGVETYEGLGAFVVPGFENSAPPPPRSLRAKDSKPSDFLGLRVSGSGTPPLF